MLCGIFINRCMFIARISAPGALKHTLSGQNMPSTHPTADNTSIGMFLPAHFSDEGLQPHFKIKLTGFIEPVNFQ